MGFGEDPPDDKKVIHCQIVIEANRLFGALVETASYVKGLGFSCLFWPMKSELCCPVAKPRRKTPPVVTRFGVFTANVMKI